VAVHDTDDFSGFRLTDALRDHSSIDGMYAGEGSAQAAPRWVNIV
jgi:hypothetical protein